MYGLPYQVALDIVVLRGRMNLVSLAVVMARGAVEIVFPTDAVAPADARDAAASSEVDGGNDDDETKN